MVPALFEQRNARRAQVAVREPAGSRSTARRAVAQVQAVPSAEAEVRETFKVPRIGLVAGCSVRSGVINRQGRARVIRDGVEIYDGNIASLRRFKDDVREVREGFECGIGIENFNDVKVGDVIECYRKEQVARTLASTASA